MKKIFKLSTPLAATLAFDAQAQSIVGYDVNWGVQAVPLSPALTLLISVVLGLAAYAFLRKRQGFAAMAVTVAGVMAAIGYNQDSIATIPVAYTITTPSGSQYVSCQDGGMLGTDQSNGVLLNAVTPVYGLVPSSAKPTLKSVATKPGNVQINNGYPNCAAGLTITPSQPCYLVGCEPV